MPGKALQNWTNLNNTQVWQMHIYLPPKTTLHCINFKKKRNCERVTLSLFAQIVWVEQLQSSKRIITFDVKIYHLFSLNHHVWFTANCLRVLKIIIYTKLNHQLFSAHSLKIKREEGSLHGNNFLGHRINALSLNKSAM